MLASSFFIGSSTPSSISLIKEPIIYFFDSRSPSRQKLSFSYRMCLNWTFLEGIAPKSSVLRPNQLHHWRQISVNGYEQRFYKFLITQVTFKVCFAIVQYTFRIFGVILLDFLAWFNFSWTQTTSLFCPQLGPLTPPQIYLSRSKNNLLVIWMEKLKSDFCYLAPVWGWFGPKLDPFCILNFPALFSDWSIQIFWRNIL